VVPWLVITGNMVLMDYFGYVIIVRKDIKPVKCDCGRMVNNYLDTNIHKKYLNLNLKNNNE
jgi:hypothetical protein